MASGCLPRPTFKPTVFNAGRGAGEDREAATGQAAVVIDRVVGSQAADDPEAGSLEEGVPTAVIGRAVMGVLEAVIDRAVVGVLEAVIDRAVVGVLEAVIDLAGVGVQAEAHVQVRGGPM